MSYLDGLEAEPWRFDVFAVLRHLERNNPNHPRLGNSRALGDDFARLGEEPYLEFPASTIAAARREGGKPLRLMVKYLGLLGPQGPLPLALTEDAYGWWLANDDAFPRFLDLFNNRFLQLFFRAWADSRPIAHQDRPDEDRFADYVGSFVGVGTPPYKQLDEVPDLEKLAYAGLIAPRTKSASRLAQFLAGLFKVSVQVNEFIGLWLSLDRCEWSYLGANHMTLGADVVLGRSVYSIQDKVKIRVQVASLAQYRRFLPTGDLCEQFADAVFFYVGAALDWEVELAISAEQILPITLGQAGELGWTSWMSPDRSSKGQAMRSDAHFNPAERLRQARTSH